MRGYHRISSPEKMLLISLFIIYLSFSMWIVYEYDTTVIWEFTRFAHDNANHLYIAATVVSNEPTSKFANMGTVWPFLYHLALIPLVKAGWLYKTGMAGSILNALLIAGTSCILLKILGGREGVLVASLFGLNIYSLIHASSSYMIPLGQFLSLFSLSYALRYLNTGSGKPLTLSVFFLMLATLSRYEAWPMVVVLAFLVIYREIKSGRKWRIYSHLPLMFMGIGGWILYNWAIFGNPFEFITHPSPGAAGYYFVVISKILAPWSIDFKGVLHIIWGMMGPLMVFLIPGVISYLKEKNGWQMLILILSSSVLLMAEGPQILIKDHLLYYYFSFPFMYLLAGRGLSFILNRVKEAQIRAVLLLILLSSYIIFTISLVSLVHMELGRAYPEYLHNKLLGDKIVMHRDEGYILYSSVLGSYYFSAFEGLKPKYIIDEYDMPLYVKASLEPWDFNVSVVVMPTEDTYAKLGRYFIGLSGKENYATLYYENATWRREFLHHYRQLFNSSVKLYDVSTLVYIRSDSS
ncbi:hypothetical protein [Thermococcus sp.]